jgi:hypothetical protein
MHGGGCDKVLLPATFLANKLDEVFNQIAQRKAINDAKYSNNYLLLDLISMFECCARWLWGESAFSRGTLQPILMMKNARTRNLIKSAHRAL